MTLSRNIHIQVGTNIDYITTLGLSSCNYNTEEGSKKV